MSARPTWFGAGVIVSVRLPPAPVVTEMLPLGTRVVLSEATLNEVRLATGVRSSPTVNGIERGALARVFVLLIEVRQLVGARFTELRVRRNEVTPTSHCE